MINKYASKRPFLLLYLVMMFYFTTNIRSQTKHELTVLKEYAGEKYGTSDFLVNGWKYYPEHFNAKGSPNFQNLNWADGSLCTTGGETFNHLDLRYNLQMDELVLKQTLSDGLPAFVMLNKDFIASFTIDSHTFIKAEMLTPDFQLSGYVEVVYSGDISLYLKHKKDFVGNYNANTPEGSFSKQITTKYIVIDNQLVKVNNKKALLALFPEHKKQIKKFMNTNKIRYKNATLSQLRMLLDYCDAL